jgi:hypothetical protein
MAVVVVVGGAEEVAAGVAAAVGLAGRLQRVAGRRPEPGGAGLGLGGGEVGQHLLDAEDAVAGRVLLVREAAGGDELEDVHALFRSR